MKTAVLLWLALVSAVPGESEAIRVAVQFIEANHPSVIRVLESEDQSGGSIRERLLAQSADAGTRVLETCVVTTRSGERAYAQSLLEVIYPTEYDVEQFRFQTPGETPPLPVFPRYVRPTDFMLAAYETRNTGVSLEVSPSLHADGRGVSLQLDAEIVRLLRNELWHEHNDEWGSAPIVMPIFETWRSGKNVLLRDGTFELVGMLTPRVQPRPPALEKRVLVFVRADVVRP
jgi:hypothetical protein